MRFGLGLPQRTDRYDIESDVARIARGAERAGYSSLRVYERVLFPLPAAGGRNGVPGLPWSDGYRTCADPFTVLALAAAELGRDPGLLELIPRANVVFRPPVARADRKPFHGSLQQVVDDITDLAELGATEVLIDLTWTARGGEELLDLALQVLGELDAAGLH